MKCGSFGAVFKLDLLHTLASFDLIVTCRGVTDNITSVVRFVCPLTITMAVTIFFERGGSVIAFTTVILSLMKTSLLSSKGVRCGNKGEVVKLVTTYVSIFSCTNCVVNVEGAETIRIGSAMLAYCIVKLKTLFFLLKKLFCSRKIHLRAGMVA